MKNQYEVGQEINLKSGFKGIVINICTKGNGDIRPPYHKEGIPQVKGINGYLGYIDIIPSEWPIYYGGEVKEDEVL